MVAKRAPISMSSEATRTRKPARLSRNMLSGGCTRDARDSSVSASERQQLVTEGLVVTQAGGGAAEADGALLQHVRAVGQGQRELGVLLGQQDREALALETR